MTEMCGPCSAEWMAWLDYSPPPPPIRLDGTGIRTVRDVQAAQERRYQDWRDTVRFQQDLIRRQCAAGHHAKDKDKDTCSTDR